MKATSNIQPAACEALTGVLGIRYQLRWNITQVQRQDEEGQPYTAYEYEYNSVFKPSALTKKNIMLALIRERYDTDDELELAMNRPEDAAAREEHEAYVAFARAYAEGVMEGAE